MTVLDLGCGDNKRDSDAVGMDMRAYPPVDVIHDIESVPWPFDADTFDGAFAYSILEHVHDLPKVMAELHRVLSPGAIVMGKVPHWSDRTAYIDPTHARFFDTRTFDYWDTTTQLGSREYFDVEYRVENVRRVRRLQFWRSRPIVFELRVIAQ